MSLFKSLLTLPVVGLLSMATFADEAPPPRGGPMSACKLDVQTLCADVQRGGGRIMQCLKSHADKVSPDCKAAIQTARDRHGQRTPDSAPPNN